MRIAALTLIGSLAGPLALGAVPAANAAPAVSSVPAAASANLVQVSGGCGPAFHRNGWGYCAPNYYAYYYPYRAGYWGYYQPRWHYHQHWRY